jgi:anti-sigma regulatory factor (Ser/Thr protein kinase)
VPYRQCPDCGITVHDSGGYSAASACPVCGASLTAGAKRFARDTNGVRRKLAREPVAASAARRALDSLIGTEEGVYRVAALLVTELIANSVLHAGPDAGEQVLLDVAVLPDRIRVEVHDQGPGFEPRARVTDDELGLHWGLDLVERLASRWDVVPGNGSGQTVVWFEVDRLAATA